MPAVNRRPSPIIWHARYNVGVDLLDQHHRQLAQLINRLAECVSERGLSESVGDVLDALVRYAEYHFRHEEALMEAAGYPALDEHRSAHLGFCETISETCYTAMHGIIGIDDLLDYLTNWWQEHILLEDMRYRPLLGALDHPDPALAP